MKTNFLFPHKLKKVGWIIFIPTFLFALFLIAYGYDMEIKCTIFAIYGDELFGKSHFFNAYQTNIIPTLTGVLFIVGGILVGFSKEQNEDEYIAKLRMESLIWATYVNYALLLLAFLFIYGVPFLTVMEFNMFTILMFFIIRFNLLLYKSKKSQAYEK